jgi:Zn-dependent protease with chaperone function
MQGVATRARQVLGVAVLAGAAAVATSTFRDGAAAWTADDRRTLVDTWLRSNAWGRVRSDDVVGAVGVVGATVVPASVKSAVRFVVVDGPVARAEAMPDGTVVVTTAALRALSTDAELAAVLAHALAHHAQGHRTALLDGSEHARSAQRALHSSNPHEAAAIVDEVLAIVDPVDESAIASATQQLLEAGGWRPHALAEAVAKLQAQRGWHTALTPSLAHTLEQMPRTGRASASQYTREVLDRVGHQR